MKQIILPSIVTVHIEEEQRLKMIDDVKNLQLRQIALFTTGLNTNQRQGCYKLLESISNLTIPFVHARSDMTAKEYEFLSKRFATKKFNIHPTNDFPLKDPLKDWRDKIYIETNEKLEEKGLQGFAGICPDLSHLENYRLCKRQVYQRIIKLLEKYPAGACHISAIYSKKHQQIDGNFAYDDHYLTNMSELNYLNNYPLEYFGEYLAIELTNSIPEQLEAQKYIQKIINQKQTAHMYAEDEIHR